MEIKRSSSQPSTKGSSEYFIGIVCIYPLFQANDPARAVGANVTFESGTRTSWHIHPLGQTLSITTGCGLVQKWGDNNSKEIHSGDVMWFPPGKKYWHGVTATTVMTHIAIQEQLDGKTAGWMKKVTVIIQRILRVWFLPVHLDLKK